MARKKFETVEKRAARFQEELKMNCTTEKGVVRQLTAEEKEYRKGYLEQIDEVVRTNVFAGFSPEESLKLNKLKGKESAIATLRGEQKYAKTQEEKRLYKRLNKRYGKKPKSRKFKPTNSNKK